MKVLGLDLDNSPLLMEDKSLKYAENIEVDDKAQSYINEPCWFQTLRLSGEPFDNKTWTLIGSIVIPNGFILFGLLDSQSAIIAYNQETNSIYKTYIGNLNFNIDYPITGVYTYKNEELVIIFRDDNNGLRILNIDSFKSKVNNTIDDSELTLLDFSPDLNRFDLNVQISSLKGTLLTGSYQIAVKFKTIFDNYTNYTTLSETIAVFEKNGNAIAPNKPSDKSIDITLNLQDNFLYTACKFAIIHITDEAQLAYETNDISINSSILNYNIANINTYNSISLEDIFIKTLNYHNAKDLVIMNNQLILGNIEKLTYPSNLDRRVSVNIVCEPVDLNTVVDNKQSFFPAGEVYIFYIGLFDQKGDLINIFPIQNKDSYAVDNGVPCNITSLTLDGNRFDAHEIPSNYTKITTTLIPTTVFSGSTYVYTDVDNYNTEEIVYFLDQSGNPINNSDIISSLDTANQKTLLWHGNQVSLYKRKYEYNESTKSYDEISIDISSTIAANINKKNYILYKESYTKVANRTETKETTTNEIAWNLKSHVRITSGFGVYSYQLFYIKHDYNNAKILTSGVLTPDTEKNDFQNQIYEQPFQSANKYRFYSFDLLFNKINIQGSIAFLEQYKSGFIRDNSQKSPQYTTVVKKFNDDGSYDIDVEGVKIWKYNKNNPLIYNTDNTSETQTLNFVLADNSFNNDETGNNKAGDSYHRIIFDNNYDYGTSFCYFINTNFNYISSLNQILQPATNISSINKTDIIIKGDYYCDYKMFRITTPSPIYRFGDSSNPDLDSNKTVYRYLIITPIISRLNVHGHYSTAINKVYDVKKLINLNIQDIFQNQEFIELIDLPYETDHPINNDLDINYSKAYNNTGIESFIYGDSLNTDNIYPHRLTRSLYYNPEAYGLPLLKFKSDDYKDLPAKYGKITVLNTNDNFLYVHQENNLSYLSIRDTLGSDPNTGASYLSSSDLFNIEAKTLGFDATGFISCNNKFDTHMNHSGYYVIDNKLHKIFKISKDSILDITSKNVSRYFKDNIKTLTDNNPFKNQGRYLFYNNDNNTLYFVQHQNNLTISYKPIIDKWISFHTRHPLFVINNTHKIFDLSSKYIYSLSNSYHHSSSREPSYIKIIFNQYPTYNKQFNVVSWLDRVTINDLPQYNETISQIAICTDYQSTDFKNINENQKWYDSTSGVKKINQWRFNEIWDIVKTTPFMNNPITFIQSALNDKIKWYNKNKIIDQYCYVILKFNNTYNKKWELIDIGVEFNLDNRNKQYEDKKE